mmetsp:Transcript_284/g.787  ORF Transcript_284/g.787 Transcript_284/m.787 type:complete len:254 (-) Transcript_284:534-1295(-)
MPLPPRSGSFFFFLPYSLRRFASPARARALTGATAAVAPSVCGLRYAGTRARCACFGSAARGASRRRSDRSSGWLSKCDSRRRECSSSRLISARRASFTARRVTARSASSVRYLKAASFSMSTENWRSEAEEAWSSRSSEASAASGETIEMAVPPCPPRAVRPTRWRYTSSEVGRSMLITAVTSVKSTPRDTPNSASAALGCAALGFFFALPPASTASASAVSAPPPPPLARPVISFGSSVATRMSKSPRLNA